ncbi:MAG: flagellar basal-body MS-ring/collar protein FliF [Candidatus Sumerlaeota bacterium]|nr:flagellar basal-body MS-ring/collar protein FliF [Candidatus Sumerlaeota bacterium]
MAGPLDIGKQLQGWFSAQSVTRRFMTVAVLVASCIGIAAFVIRVKTGNLDLLYGRLSEEDAGTIVERLKARNIEYQIREGGQIYVPSTVKYELRAELAAEGLPYNGGGVGFEIFDKSQIGMTSYHQRINFQRALRGELGRTISSLSVVRSARVTIQNPEPSPFIEEEQKPSATVVVDLKNGQTLTGQQVRGIAYIVSAAVTGLTMESVKVVNGRGELLSPGDTGKLGDETTQQLVYQRNHERKIGADVEALLEPWFGRGHVKAQVGATFDFTQTETTSEEYEEDNKTLTNERHTGNRAEGLAPSPRGVPGTTSNVPGALTSADADNVKKAGAAAAAAEPDGGLYSLTRTYVPGRRVVRKKTPIASLTNLQVAVFVDKNYDAKTEPDKDGKTPPPPTPKSDVEIEKEKKMVEEAVKKAIGFKDERNDSVEVSFVPFQKNMVPVTEDETYKPVATWILQIENLTKPFIIPGVMILSVFLLIFMVVRPFLKHLDRQLALTRPAQTRLRSVADLEAGLDGAQGGALELPEGSSIEDAISHLRKRGKDNITDQVMEISKSDPDKTAKMIKSWLES